MEESKMAKNTVLVYNVAERNKQGDIITLYKVHLLFVSNKDTVNHMTIYDYARSRLLEHLTQNNLYNANNTYGSINPNSITSSMKIVIHKVTYSGSDSI